MTDHSYPRAVQGPKGSMQAQYLAKDDVIMIRRAGAIERTPETITGVTRDGRDVIIDFDGWSHRTSADMHVGWVSGWLA